MFTNPTVLGYEIAARRSEAPRQHNAGLYTFARGRLLLMPRVVLLFGRPPRATLGHGSTGLH
jgi:hypothetical protein